MEKESKNNAAYGYIRRAGDPGLVGEPGPTGTRAYLDLLQGPPSSEPIKLCPFRQEHGNMNDGGFLPCYGAECMAYLEYDATQFIPVTDGQEKLEAQHVKLCRMMPYPTYYGGGCSI